MYKYSAFFLALITATGAVAETRYVSDQLEITLRTGQSTKHQILRMLKSGTALAVLGEDPESGYTHVRTPEGREGWVLSRFLMDHPSARDRLDKAQQRLAAVEIENKQLKEKLARLGQEKQSADKSQQDLTEQNRRLDQELTRIRKTAASALAIDAENKKLQEQLVNLQTELQALQQENATLSDRSARDWFVRGAGVIIAGILLGLIIPRLRFRRKSSWDRL
ncbi:MAG TPA: TIGR04211 family SH3 domain-containing protein [Gammaproteobacteria bacterium]|nr:TIGR04211 family SH3 domain-containing protein [Gammaproteobacteria bacterium]